MKSIHKKNHIMLDALDEYLSVWNSISKDFLFEQKRQYLSFREFMLKEDKPFERATEIGHVTGSGFVLSSDKTHLLMNHHKKLDKWLQLGGHADSNPHAYEVALTECLEESSLQSLKFFPLEMLAGISCVYPVVFDLDRHMIPEKGSEKGHYHYDVRYLLIADRDEPFTVSDESYDLKWVPLEEVLKLNNEPSIERPLRKIQYLIDNYLD
ncbi:MAG: hypothetical protein S4CHLAM37_06550 [Chlamydiia bacterium]|nr:hypothetical protein [Chlamydiia bacterium]